MKKITVVSLIITAAFIGTNAQAEWGRGLGRECKTSIVPAGQQSGWGCDAMPMDCCATPKAEKHAAKQEMKQEKKAVPAKEWRLTGVTFETGSDRLKSESQASLNEAVDVLKENPSVKVEIQGHTDNVGNADANMTLSQKRADAVKAYLVDKGIAANRLETKGYGANKPVSDNNTDAGRADNRRIEFKVTHR